MNIILIGPPGAGKGTQAEKISEKYQIPTISTGDIFRDHIKNETAIGLKVKEIIHEGQLVPDDITIGLVQERISKQDCIKGYVLDGFPRTIHQAEALDQILAENSQHVDLVVCLVVNDETIIERLSGRRLCKECGKPYHLLYNPPLEKDVCDKCSGALYQRDDDQDETVRQRLVTFHQQTAPLIDYYEKCGKIANVIGREKIEDTTAGMFTVLDQRL